MFQLLLLFLTLSISTSFAQNQNNQLESFHHNNNDIDFTNKNDLLSSPDFNSVLIVGISDMNADGLDDIIRLEGATFLTVEYQQNGNQYQHYDFGVIASNQQWNIAVADVDNNGFNDIMIGGLMDGIKLYKANSLGNDFDESILPNSSFFSQGSNFSDINNDGFADVFICNDEAESRIWGNDGSGVFYQADTWIDMSTIPPSDGSGNYASVWTDFDNDGDLDLYISKCKAGVSDPTDPRRVNQLFVNENGQFVESAEIYGLKNGAQSWTTDFQDIDNDGDLDCFVVNHEFICQLYENDGNGMFSDITLVSGLNITTDHLQGLMRDFDNDGFVDILVAGNEGYEYFQNNGDGTFLQIEDLFGSYLMSTFAVGDLNHDGFLDIYSGSLTSEDVLWINNHNDNHFFAVNLQGTSSSVNALGARLELYGAWGVQLREVRSGESYGIMNSYTQFFGLGAEDQIDSLVIKWPSGLVETVESPLVDQFLKVIEGDCAYPGKHIFSNGITTVCTGSELELVAPAGDNYLWSNGAMSQQLFVTEGGTYTVTVTNDNGCSTVSNPIEIIQDPDETPVISVSGPTTFCAGGSVILFSSEAESYEWSNGFTSPNIPVFTSGEYTVTVPGFCHEFTSEPVVVTAIDIPDDPVAENDTIYTVPDVAILTATGNNLHWYDSLSSNDTLATGSIFTTPLLNETTSFYVADVNEVNNVICESDRVEVLAVVDTTTSVEAFVTFGGIAVYPNPAFQEFMLDLKNNNPLNLILELRDFTGKLVFSKMIEKGNNPLKTTISVSKFSSGMYYLSVWTKEERYVQKLIIQKD